MQLLRNEADFRRLWLAQTVSQIGSQVSYLAIPVTAAVVLDAGPAEMGLLTALSSLPALTVGLVAGAMVDRRQRRPVLISADLARALLLGLIPLAWLAGALSMPLLYLVAFLAGASALFFDLAYQAFLPALLDRRTLIAANSQLELSRSAAEMAGPTIAGGLIQLLKAPLAIAVDALSFLLSALLIARIRTREAPVVRDESSSLRADALAGAREALRDPAIRALTVSAAGIGLFNAMIEAVVVLYLLTEIGMQPGLLGLLFAAGSAGFLLGALLPNRVAGRLGIGPTLAGAIALVGLSDLLLPLAGRDLLLVAGAVALGQFCFGLGWTLFSVAQVSLKQAIVPAGMMGRVTGAMRVAGWGMAPLGALLGGLLGAWLGLQPTLMIASLLEAAVALWIWRSPLWAFRDLDLVTESAPAG